MKGLASNGPATESREKLMLFGQLVGDWEITETRNRMSDGSWVTGKGEIHMRWILNGRGVQDIFGPIDEATGQFIPVGTTVRFYDESIDAWRSTWNAPLQHEQRTFIGGPVGSEIVLRESNPAPGLDEHWIFSEIGRDTFRWRAERLNPETGRREIVERMEVRRLP